LLSLGQQQPIKISRLPAGYPQAAWCGLRDDPVIRTLGRVSKLIRAVPADDATELDWLLFEQLGVLTWQQAISLASPSRVRHLLESGRWQRVCRGVLVANTGELTRGQQLWVAVLAAGPGAVLAGATATGEAGVRGVRQEPLYVLLPGARVAPDLRRRLPLGMPGVAPPGSPTIMSSPDDPRGPPRRGRWSTPRSGREPRRRPVRSSPRPVNSDGSRPTNCARYSTRCPGHGGAASSCRPPTTPLAALTR
jgi:hypothetical protein